jgi:hypothetical protein
MKTIDEILKTYRVKSYKETSEGLIAIRKGGFWLYFRFDGKEYVMAGSTIKFEYWSMNWQWQEILGIKDKDKGRTF